MQQFIVTISDHKQWGLVLEAFMIDASGEGPSFNSLGRLTSSTISSFEDDLTENQKEIVNIIESYNNNTIFKRFCTNKRTTMKKYIESITEDDIKTTIRPYIEKKILEIWDIVQADNIDVYVKNTPQVFSVFDKVTIERDNCLSILSLTKDGEGLRYSIKNMHNSEVIDIKNNKSQFFMLSPCKMLIGKTLYSFDIRGIKLRPFMKKNVIPIPSDKEAVWLNAFGIENIRKYEIEAKGFDIVDAKLEKRAVLKLELGIGGKPVATHKFIYGDKPVNCSSDKVEQLTLSADGQNMKVTRFERDMEWEKSCLSALESGGLKKYCNSSYAPDYADGASIEEMTTIFADTLTKADKSIKEAGFEIEHAL